MQLNDAPPVQFRISYNKQNNTASVQLSEFLW
jgi:hypothetical protein